MNDKRIMDASEDLSAEQGRVSGSGHAVDDTEAPSEEEAVKGCTRHAHAW